MINMDNAGFEELKSILGIKSEIIEEIKKELRMRLKIIHPDSSQKNDFESDGNRILYFSIVEALNYITKHDDDNQVQLVPLEMDELVSRITELEKIVNNIRDAEKENVLNDKFSALHTCYRQLPHFPVPSQNRWPSYRYIAYPRTPHQRILYPRFYPRPSGF